MGRRAGVSGGLGEERGGAGGMREGEGGMRYRNRMLAMACAAAAIHP